MQLTCWLGVHQWRVDHYSDFIAEEGRKPRMVWISRVSCARCGLLRSKSVVSDAP